MSQDYVNSSGGDKPCRACTDFKSWMKAGLARSTRESKETDQQLPESAASAKGEGNHEARDILQQTTRSSTVKSDLLPEAKAAAGQIPAGETQDQADLIHGVCPPDRGELGSATWSFLHSVAAYYPARPTPQHEEDARQLMRIVSRLYPCSDCAEDLRKDLIEDPPIVSSSAEFSEWMCRLHNKVNVKLGKPTFDCTKVFERWRDGWKDGSCD